MGGDGIIGAVAGELRARRRPAGGLARRARERLRAQARRSRSTRVEAAKLLQTGRRARGRPRRGRRHDLPGHPQRRASTPTSTGSRSRRACKLGTFVYTYGVLRAIARWQGRRPGRSRSTATTHAFPRLLRRGLQLRRLRRRDVPGARRRARRRPARRRDDRRPVQARATCAACPACSRAPTSRTRRSRSSRAARSPSSADRPFTAYADGDPIAELPATVRALPGALRVVAPR